MVSETHLGPALLLIVSAATMGGQAADAQADEEASEARVIQVPWHFYRHYPADFSAWSRARVTRSLLLSVDAAALTSASSRLIRSAQ